MKIFYYDEEDSIEKFKLFKHNVYEEMRFYQCKKKFHNCKSLTKKV